MIRFTGILVLALAVGVLVGVGCAEQERHSTYEEHTTRTVESGPVLTPAPAPPATGPAVETHGERVISREPVVK